MAEPVVIQCASTCTATVVHEISFPPFSLTLEEAQQIAPSILVAWAVAWVVRQVIRLIRDSGPTEPEKEN